MFVEQVTLAVARQAVLLALQVHTFLPWDPQHALLARQQGITPTPLLEVL